MQINQTRIPIQVPTSVDPVRMHDQRPVWRQRITELLQLASLVSSGTVVRNHRLRLGPSRDHSRDISNPRILHRPSGNINRSDRHRRSSCPSEPAVNLIERDYGTGGRITAKCLDGRLRSLGRQYSVSQTVGDYNRYRRFLYVDGPAIARNILAAYGNGNPAKR